MKSVLLLVALSFLTVTGASASIINLSQEADITQNAQGFLFDFSNLAKSNHTGGTLTISGSGDFTADNDGKHQQINSQENVNITFDSLFGSVLIDEAGVLSNTVNGLELLSFTSYRVFYVFDIYFAAVFTVSADLLDAMLDDNSINFALQNGKTVGRFFYHNKENTDRDFLSVALTYNAPLPGIVAVSAPGGVLIILAAAFLGRLPRRATRVPAKD